MERRDFLVGSFVGVGAGVAVDRLAGRLEVETAEAERAAAEERAAAAEQAASQSPATTSGPTAAAEPSASQPPGIGEVELGPQPPDGRQVSYAQQGEDLILLGMLETLGITRPRYLDVGAFHPTISSNTFLLYLHGGQGVLVEPNPQMAPLIARARPRDTFVNAGVGIDDARQADYFMLRDRPQLNTFSKAQAERYTRQGLKVERVPDMPLRPIGEIIAEHFDDAPDLLSLDVEGLDLAILKTLDLERIRPAVLCVETLVFETRVIVGEILELLRSKEYVVRGGTFVNTVFVDARRLEGGDGPGGRLGL